MIDMWRHHRREVRHAHLPEPRRCMGSGQARLRHGGGRGLGADQLVDIDNDGRPEPRTWRCRSACSGWSRRSLSRARSTRRSPCTRPMRTECMRRSRGSSASSRSRSASTPAGPRARADGSFDVNGDGFADLLTPGDGNQVEVWLGGVADLKKLAGRQELPANGRLRGGDGTATTSCALRSEAAANAGRDRDQSGSCPARCRTSARPARQARTLNGYGSRIQSGGR